MTYVILKKSRARYPLQKIKFFMKNFFSKCDQIHKKLRIWSHLLEKPLMENFSFCAVTISLISDHLGYHLSFLFIWEFKSFSIFQMTIGNYHYGALYYIFQKC